MCSCPIYVSCFCYSDVIISRLSTILGAVDGPYESGVGVSESSMPISSRSCIKLSSHHFASPPLVWVVVRFGILPRVNVGVAVVMSISSNIFVASSD